MILGGAPITPASNLWSVVVLVVVTVVLCIIEIGLLNRIHAIDNKSRDHLI